MSKVLIYKKTPCPYCDRAASFLENNGISYEAVDLTDKPGEIELIKNETGWKTVPIIFINGKLVGGYSDLKALADEGKLQGLLEEQQSV